MLVRSADVVILLLSPIPNQLRHGQPTSKNDRSLSAPSCRRPGFETLTGAGGAGPLPAGLEASNGRAGLTRTLSGWGTMGNKQPRLDGKFVLWELIQTHADLMVNPQVSFIHESPRPLPTKKKKNKKIKIKQLKISIFNNTKFL